MRHLKILAATLALVAPSAQAQDAGGIWQTEPGDTGGFLHVTIAPCADKVCGTIRTAFNADGSVVGDYAHIGKPLIWDMTADGSDAWSGGKIWAPDRDKTYRSKMSLSGSQLKVSGCVAGGLICRSQNWVRVQ